MDYTTIKQQIMHDLDILDTLYRVKCIRVAAEHEMLGGDKGNCFYRQKFPRHESRYEIYIRSDLQGIDFVRTLAHELRHVWQWESYKDSWSDNDRPYDERRCEADANEYASVFVAQWSA